MRKGWQLFTIANVCRVVNGGTPKTKVAEYWGGEHAWITPAEMGKLSSPYMDSTKRLLTDEGLSKCSGSLLPIHSVILSSRAPIGHLVINKVPMATNQGCKGLVPKENLYFKYLYYFLYCNIELLNSLGTGATFRELSATKLKEVQIPIPPLPEQKRIVTILDEAFAGINQAVANAEKNLANARELFESILENSFDSINDNKSVPLADLCHADKVITYGVIKLGKHINDGVPCLRTSNVRKLSIDRTGMKIIAEDLSDQYNRTVLTGGEVLINVRGTLGGVAVVPDEMKGWNVSREVAVVPVNPKKIDPVFLALNIATANSQKWLTGVLKGVAYSGINLSDLRNLPICIPAPEVQCEVVKKLYLIREHVRRLETIYIDEQQKYTQLKQSILQKAFTGNLAKDAA